MNKRNHLVYLGVSGFPKGLAAIQRQLLVSKGLSENGWDITILCSGSVHQKESNIPKEGTFEGIYFKYIFSPYREENFFKRNLQKKISIFFELYELIKLNKKQKIDAVLISNTNIFWYAFIIFLVSKILKFKSVLSLVEIYKSRTNITFFKRINDKLFNQFGLYFFDAYFPISHQLIEHFKHFKLPYFYFPILVDSKKFDEIKVNSARDINYLFCGAAGYPKTIEYTIKAFEKANVPNAILILVSNGSHKEIKQIKLQIQNSPKNATIFHKQNLSELELYEYYKNATALLLPLYSTIQDESRFPHKLGEYLASGNPVITCQIGELKYYLKHKESAFICTPNNILEFAGYMEYVSNNAEIAKLVGEKGKLICKENFDYLALGKQCSIFLTQLIQNAK
jgi:glycosyltransferase involved in cell wall biosynthesis